MSAARALILAAGRGARLRPLTDDRPKCCVRLAGRRLLDWQLDALSDAGISDVAVVTGWRGDRVVDPELTRFENADWHRTAMVASLLTARDWLAAGPCVVVYGDVVFRAAIACRLAESAHDLAITYDTAWRTLWEARFAKPDDDAESCTAEGGLLRDIGGPVRDCREVPGQFMGLLRITPRGLARIDSWLALQAPAVLSQVDTTHLLAGLVAAGTAVGAIAVEGGWCEVDSLTDLALYERGIAAGREWLHDWRLSHTNGTHGGTRAR